MSVLYTASENSYHSISVVKNHITLGIEARIVSRNTRDIPTKISPNSNLFFSRSYGVLFQLHLEPRRKHIIVSAKSSVVWCMFHDQYGHSGECLRQGFSHTTTGYLSVDRVRFWRFWEEDRRKSGSYKEKGKLNSISLFLRTNIRKTAALHGEFLCCKWWEIELYLHFYEGSLKPVCHVLPDCLGSAP